MFDTILTKLSDPGKEYTLVPLWFWNDTLDEKTLEKQMDEMKERSVDAFVIHPRKGLDPEIGYLTDKYFHFVRFALQKAKEKDMRVMLYDEAQYPSGSCHGMVAGSDPRLASKALTVTKDPSFDEGELLAESMFLGERIYYRIVDSKGTIRGVFEGEDDGEPNGPKAADLLSYEAMKKFIELTYQRYYDECEEYFKDGTIIGFFTDEPMIFGRNSRSDIVIIPWTYDIFDEFKKKVCPLDDMIYLFSWIKKENDKYIMYVFDQVLETDDETYGKYSQIHRRFNEFIHDRLALTLYSQLSSWCEKHGTCLTGHPEKSNDIDFLKYFQIPSQDVVWRMITEDSDNKIKGDNSTAGKCSSDSARHRGKRRNGNECFGVCSKPETPYTFTEENMLWYSNWLFARGVNMLMPHAYFYSIRGNRKDERPPDVGLNNGFWPEYKRYAVYAKRMSYLLTDSYNLTDIAVLAGKEHLSWKIARYLFENQYDFNYLEEILLPCCTVHDGYISIEKQKYDNILIERPFYDTLCKKTLKILSDMEKKGIRIIILESDVLDDDEKMKTALSALSRTVVCSGLEKGLRVSMLEKDGAEFIIAINEGQEKIDTLISVPGKRILSCRNMYPEITDTTEFNEGRLRLSLERYSSAVIEIQQAE